MSDRFYIKSNALHFKGETSGTEIYSSGGDLYICVSDSNGNVKKISVLDMFNRLNDLEKNIAELILLGEKKDG